MSKLRPAYGIAILLFALGLFVTWRAVQSTPLMLARIERKLSDLEELRRLVGQSRNVMAVLQLFDQLDAHAPRALADIADQTGLSRPALRRRDEATPAAGGWRLLTMTATFEDIPLSALSAFIREAAVVEGHPPWRLIECNINALDQGRGRAALVLEAMEKPGPRAEPISTD